MLSGILTSLDGAYSCPCAVKSLSPTGARVTADTMQLSSDVYLILPRERKAYKARLKRFDGKDVALTFEQIIELDAKLEASLTFLRRLCI